MTDLHDKLRGDLRGMIELDEPFPESVYIDVNGDVQLKPGRSGLDDLRLPASGDEERGGSIDALSTEPTDAERASVSALARMVLLRRRSVIDLTARLKSELEDLRRLEEHDLPDAMREIDRNGFQLADGTPVRLKTQLRSGAVTDPQRLAWIAANGGKSLIKGAITVEFDREDVDVARAVFDRLRNDPAADRFKKLTLAEHVHPMTMIGLCNELVEQLKDPPLEMLGVQRQTRAIVGERTPKIVELKGLVER